MAADRAAARHGGLVACRDEPRARGLGDKWVGLPTLSASRA